MPIFKVSIARRISEIVTVHVTAPSLDEVLVQQSTVKEFVDSKDDWAWTPISDSTSEAALVSVAEAKEISPDSIDLVIESI